MGHFYPTCILDYVVVWAAVGCCLVFPLGVPCRSVVFLVLSLTVAAMRAPVHVSKVDLVVFGGVGFFVVGLGLLFFKAFYGVFLAHFCALWHCLHYVPW